MARGALTVQEIGVHGDSINTVAWTAADESNDHEFVNDGKTLLLVKDGTGSQVVTVVSVADQYGRTGDTTITTTAVGISAAGPFAKHLFNQSDGVVHVDIVAETTLFFAAVKFNPSVS